MTNTISFLVWDTEFRVGYIDEPLTSHSIVTLENSISASAMITQYVKNKLPKKLQITFAKDLSLLILKLLYFFNFCPYLIYILTKLCVLNKFICKFNN